jgi:hypothetical protein
LRSGTDAALKVLVIYGLDLWLAQIAQDPTFKARFRKQREAKSLASAEGAD